MNLKKAFGEPGKGLHSYRLFGVAIVDVIMTLIGAILISYMFNLPFFYVAIVLFVLGIVLHRLFHVRTTVDKTLFPDYN